MALPTKLLMDRKLKFFLSSHIKQLNGKFNIEEAQIALKNRQFSQNGYATKYANFFPELNNNTKMWFKRKIKELWKQGIIIQVGS